MGILSKSDIKEQLSVAYAQAIIAKAGYTFGSWNLDRESIDISVRADDAAFPTVHLQLKETASPNWTKSGLAFSLSRKNYQDLSADRFESILFI